MAQVIGRTKPQTNTGSGSLYYDLWRQQGKKCGLTRNAIAMSSSVYVNTAKTLLVLEASLGGDLVGYTKVDLSSTIGENKAQQVGDPDVW